MAKNKRAVSRKLFVLILAAAIILFLLLNFFSSSGSYRSPSKETTKYTVLFQDVFSSGKDKWTDVAGVWNVSNDVISHPFTDPCCQFTTAGDNWTDFTASADMKFSGDIGKKGYSAAGLAFRVIDPYNLYLADLQISGTTRLVLLRKIKGTYEEIASSPIELRPNQWYHVKVSVKDSKIDVYVNNMLAVSIIDDSIKAGKIGLKSSWTDSEFDNVVVTEYNE